MATEDKTEWRIVYVKSLGEKKMGIKPKDYFKFFDNDVFCLKPDYCAYLEFHEPLDHCWRIFSLILVGDIYKNYIGIRGTPEFEVSQFTLIDDTTGEIIGRVKKGMICEYLQINHPSYKSFLNIIKSIAK